MKKTGLYITMMAMSLLWITPTLTYADITKETVSNVIEVPEEEDITATTGPAVAAQKEVEAAAAQAEAAQAAFDAAAKAEAEAALNSSATRRQNLVNFALQFVGGPYRAGGTNPRTGADCSGFTQYVLKHGAGVSLNRTSTAQSTQGVPVSSSQMQPGDLLFYSSGSRINHVAMYIGNGQVVHSSTPKTGIKTAPWNYRTPVRIMNVLG